MTPNSSNPSNKPCLDESTPKLIDLVIEFLRDQFPGSVIMVSRGNFDEFWGCEIRIDDKLVGRVHGDEWHEWRWSDDAINPLITNMPWIEIIRYHSADPEFFNKVLTSCLNVLN